MRYHFLGPTVWRSAYGRHGERCSELAARAREVLHLFGVAAEPAWDFLCALTGRRAPDRRFPAHRSRPLSRSSAPLSPTDSAGQDGPLRRAPIQVRPSPLGGRGVFAAKPIRSGALLEECPVIDTHGDVEELGDYVIGWGTGEDDLALPLGYGACYNHSGDPNAYWEADLSRGLMVIWAARDLAADEEILISYGDEWFPNRGLVPTQESGGAPGSGAQP